MTMNVIEKYGELWNALTGLNEYGTKVTYNWKNYNTAEWDAVLKHCFKQVTPPNPTAPQLKVFLQSLLGFKEYALSGTKREIAARAIAKFVYELFLDHAKNDITAAEAALEEFCKDQKKTLDLYMPKKSIHKTENDGWYDCIPRDAFIKELNLLTEKTKKDSTRNTTQGLVKSQIQGSALKWEETIYNTQTVTLFLEDLLNEKMPIDELAESLCDKFLTDKNNTRQLNDLLRTLQMVCWDQTPLANINQHKFRFRMYAALREAEKMVAALIEAGKIEPDPFDEFRKLPDTVKDPRIAQILTAITPESVRQKNIEELPWRASTPSVDILFRLVDEVEAKHKQLTGEAEGMLAKLAKPKFVSKWYSSAGIATYKTPLLWWAAAIAVLALSAIALLNFGLFATIGLPAKYALMLITPVGAFLSNRIYAFVSRKKRSEIAYLEANHAPATPKSVDEINQLLFEKDIIKPVLDDEGRLTGTEISTWKKELFGEKPDEAHYHTILKDRYSRLIEMLFNTDKSIDEIARLLIKNYLHKPSDLFPIMRVLCKYPNPSLMEFDMKMVRYRLFAGLRKTMHHPHYAALRNHLNKSISTSLKEPAQPKDENKLTDIEINEWQAYYKNRDMQSSYKYIGYFFQQIEATTSEVPKHEAFHKSMQVPYYMASANDPVYQHVYKDASRSEKPKGPSWFSKEWFLAHKKPIFWALATVLVVTGIALSFGSLATIGVGALALTASVGGPGWLTLGVLMGGIAVAAAPVVYAGASYATRDEIAELEVNYGEQQQLKLIETKQHEALGGTSEAIDDIAQTPIRSHRAKV